MDEHYQNIDSNILSNTRKRYDISPIKYKADNYGVNFMLKKHREQLISKRKEFIQNYRKKQRLLTLMESNNENKNNYNNNISIETIKNMIDPISRIIVFKKYIFLNNSTIDINFINNNINILKEWLNDYKKYLFDYDNNKNISKQIIINRYIIYIIL